jgi:hypothetical protein
MRQSDALADTATRLADQWVRSSTLPLGPPANRHTLESLELAHHLVGIVDQIQESIVTLARADGASWAEIGDAAGMSKQGAQQRWGDVS